MPWWASCKRSAACLIAWVAWAEQPPMTPGDTRGPVNAHTWTPYRGGQALDVSATAHAQGDRDTRGATTAPIQESGAVGAHVKVHKSERVSWRRCDLWVLQGF